uniref:PDZ domain-containing protein n=1 Tax=Amphilophus citrinellus TaxID=61819 RepID=A0A3Q0QRP6_AMPCI
PQKNKDGDITEEEKDIINKAHGLGIGLVGNKDGSRARMGVYVADIDPLGPAADSDGRLLLGDQILSINGEDVRAASQEHAQKLLQTKGTVVLTHALKASQAAGYRIAMVVVVVMMMMMAESSLSPSRMTTKLSHL